MFFFSIPLPAERLATRNAPDRVKLLIVAFMARENKQSEPTGFDLTAAIRQIVREEIEQVKGEISTPAAPKPPRTYTREQVAKEILHCSYPTFHRLANAGAFQVIKVGSNTLVLADDFDARLAAGQIAKYKRY